MASTAVPAIPPFGKMNMHAILFEGVLWGMNVVIFSSCIYVLKKRMRSASWLLTGGTTLLFCLSTAHFVISWFTLVQAFTQAPNNLSPLGPDLYFARLNSPLAVAQAEIYIFNVWGQDLLLIWRLYMVLGRNWKVVVIPLIIEAVHIACAFLSIGLLARPGANLFSPTIQAWGKASWSLDLILNTSLTCVIAFYLWRAGRETASLTRTGRNKYTETVLTIVESGAIYAIATLVIFALDIAGDPAGFVGVSGVIQLATLTPLLIVVRVGLGLTRDNTTFHTSQIPSTLVTSQPYSGIHVNISKNTESRIDSAYGMKTMSSVGQHSTIVGDVRGDDKV